VSRYRRRAVAMAIAGAFAVAPLVSACAAGQHPQSVLPTRLTEGVNASVGHVDVRNAFVLGPEPGQRLPVGSSAPFYAWIVNKATTPDRLVGVEAPGWAQSVEIAGGGLSLPPNQLVSTNLPTASPQPSGVPTPGTSPSGTPSAPAKKPAPGKPGKPGAPSGAQAGTPGAGTQSPGAPASTTPTGPAVSPPPSAPSTAGTAAGGPAVILKGLTRELMGGENIRLTLHFQQAGSLTVNVPVVPRADYYATYPPAPSGGTTSTPPGAPAPGSPAPGTTPGGTATPGASGSPSAGAASPAAKPGKHARAKKASPKPTA
jgi:copper(I)-binding protein